MCPPPKKYAVGGILLDANYATTAKKNKALLLHEADTQGLGDLGDGATIKKKPLSNVLATGFHAPAVVLGICDCSKHLGNGEKRCGVHCKAFPSTYGEP